MPDHQLPDDESRPAYHAAVETIQKQVERAEATRATAVQELVKIAAELERQKPGESRSAEVSRAVQRGDLQEAKKLLGMK